MIWHPAPFSICLATIDVMSFAANALILLSVSIGLRVTVENVFLEL